MLLQNFALVSLFGLLSWFTMHQGSHCTYFAMGRTDRATSLNIFFMTIMRVETFSHGGFLIWYAYMTGIYNAFELIGLSFIFVLLLKMLEHSVALNQRAWLTSISGIAFVPALIIALIWIVRFPISN